MWRRRGYVSTVWLHFTCSFCNSDWYTQQLALNASCYLFFFSFFLSFTDFSLFLAAVFLFSVALTCPYTLYPLEFVSYSRWKVLDFHSRLNLLLFSGALFFCSTPFVAIRRRCLPQPIALHETCLTRWISTARRLFGNLRHICYS